MKHESPLHITSPLGSVGIIAGGSVTFWSQLDVPAPVGVVGRSRQTRLIVNGVEDATWVTDNDIFQPREITRTFPTAGTYSVQVQFRHRQNYGGSYDYHTSVETITVRVLNTPTITGPFAVCQGVTTATLETPIQDGCTYQWLANGTAVGQATSDNTFTIPTTTPGSVDYSVRLIYNGVVVTTSADHTVEVVALPTVDITPATESICAANGTTDIILLIIILPVH